jgi:hypothetical protein
MHDRVWHARIANEFFLRDLGAEMAALREPIGADNRKRDVMPDARLDFRPEQIAARRFEEGPNGVVLERRGIGEIDRRRRILRAPRAVLRS